MQSSEKKDPGNQGPQERSSKASKHTAANPEDKVPSSTKVSQAQTTIRGRWFTKDHYRRDEIDSEWRENGLMLRFLIKGLTREEFEQALQTPRDEACAGDEFATVE